jgi:serine/threonine-protein kinase
MEHQTPRSKTLGEAPNGNGPGPATVPLNPDTKIVRTTDTPDENDPIWAKLGATNIVEGSALSSGDVPAAHAETVGAIAETRPAIQYTELSPSRVLGKNVLRIGDYRLIRKIGEGAMGAVYKAEQISRKRFVAIKVLFPHIANNKKLVDRMHREGRIMGLLGHPNIVEAYDCDFADGCHYVAMEYVSGQSMQKWLMQLGRINVGDAVRITLDCAKAISYAHANNVIHRDIKPDNILVTKTGTVKVADLGMAKQDDGDMSLTQTGHAVGTPWYMPLEQARNAKEIDGRSDIYALGCTLYAFLTGDPPFSGRTIVEVIQKKTVGRFPPARKVNADVPERLDMILIKMTAKEPKHRYANCDELIADLGSLGLASNSLTFIKRRATQSAAKKETVVAEETNVSTPDSGEEGISDLEIPKAGSPEVDAGYWYVQMRMPDGSQVTRKFTTGQLKKMLAEGTMTANARVSHSPTEGFRSIATYKEFQGTALSKASRQAADKSTIRYRNLYKKIEAKERQRDDEKAEVIETPMGANTRYWFGVLWPGISIGAGVVLVLTFLYWLMLR